MADKSEGSGARPSGGWFWLLTADSRSARLLRGSMTEHDRLHLDQVAELRETWQEKEHSRPSARTTAHGPAHAPQSHEEEERVHRFARELAAWLERQNRDHHIERLHAFCAKRLLGPLRKVLPERLRAQVVDHPNDLAGLSASQLATHAAVIEVAREERARAAPGSAPA